MWTTVILLSFAVLLLYLKLRSIFKTFERLGIKGPPPTFLFGNLLDLYCLKPGQTRSEIFSRWVSEYGLVFGYFEGVHPVLYVANPDTLQQILQTDFQNFINRPLRDDIFSGSRGDVFFSRGQRWKRVRSVLSPVFSPANMRAVAPAVDEKVQTLINKLNDISSGGEGFDIYEQFQRLTMDVIAQMAFGTNINCIADGSHPFIHHCKEFFRRVATRPIHIEAVFHVCPNGHARRFIYGVLTLAAKALRGTEDLLSHFYYLSGVAKKAIDDRRENPIFYMKPDLLGLMMKNESGAIDSENNERVKGHFKKHVTTQEIQMNCWLFLVAGYETTSTALAYLAHVLCKHPTVQDRLAEEIRHFETMEDEGRNGGLSHETTQKMDYLDQVIRETLRMFPPAPFLRRESIADITLNVPGKTVQIPKDVSFQIDSMATHYSPQFWRSPETFDPSRFSSEAKKDHHMFQYLPFGLGPRGCMGLRLAMMEIKLSLVNLVKNFRIEPCDKTVANLEYLEGITRTPKNGLFVRLSPRNS